MRALRGPATLVALALAAWIVAVVRMRGMDAGPGTDLGGFGWFLGIWMSMMAAMMLPSATPMVLLFARVSGERARRRQSFVPTWVFVAGYFVTWAAFGSIAYGVYRGVRAFESGFLDWDRGGAYVAGAALVGAGLYELTPLKNACLRHCRSPMHFVLGGWREGRVGAFRMGAEHGAYCVGCCWGLMLALFVLGVMSLVWMAAVAAVILIEKVAPQGERLTRMLSITLIAFGIWIAAAPSTVPGLTQPGAADGAKTELPTR